MAEISAETLSGLTLEWKMNVWRQANVFKDKWTNFPRAILKWIKHFFECRWWIIAQSSKDLEENSY